MKPNYVYLASSWRNREQPIACEMMRQAGIDHYDFRNPPNGTGFSWNEVQPINGDKLNIKAKGSDWKSYSDYIMMISHPRAREGFDADFEALQKADWVIMLLPCGKSAHLELGYAIGRSHTAIVCEDPMEPELMYKMADHIFPNIESLISYWLEL